MHGVVFDLDGTLIDGYEGIATGVNAARAAFSLPALSIDEVRGRVGAGLLNLMESVVGAGRAAEGTAIFREVYDRVCEDQSRAVPGLHEALAALAARGVRLSVASNKPADFSIRILTRLGVRGAFDTIEGPETAGTFKPEPEMILACLSAMKVEKRDAIYVGDMAIDAVAGARAGIDVVLVRGGSSSEAELAATGAQVIDSLSQLPALT